MIEIVSIVGPFALDLTLREALWALEAKQSRAWDHTASIMTILAEINRDHKKSRRPFTLEDFHPYRKRKKKKKLVVGIKALKAVFVDKNRDALNAEIKKAEIKGVFK